MGSSSFATDRISSRLTPAALSVGGQLSANDARAARARHPPDLWVAGKGLAGTPGPYLWMGRRTQPLGVEMGGLPTWTSRSARRPSSRERDRRARKTTLSAAICWIGPNWRIRLQRMRSADRSSAARGWMGRAPGTSPRDSSADHDVHMARGDRRATARTERRMANQPCGGGRQGRADGQRGHLVVAGIWAVAVLNSGTRSTS